MSGKSLRASLGLVGLLGLMSLTVGCAGPLPAPTEVVCPTPIVGSTGKYCCPYTSDAVLAKWVDKAIAAKAAGDIAGTAAGIGVHYAASNVPFLSLITDPLVNEGVRLAFIQACGGEKYIRETSDLSFDRVEDLDVYLYAKYSGNEHYKDAWPAITSMYPEAQSQFDAAIRAAAIKK